MTVKELKEQLNNYPDNAEVLLECDHGQNIESANYITASRSVLESDEYENMIFEFSNWRNCYCYDEEAIENYDENGKITAVLIQS